LRNNRYLLRFNGRYFEISKRRACLPIANLFLSPVKRKRPAISFSEEVNKRKSVINSGELPDMDIVIKFPGGSVWLIKINW
jgi:hypothetical protein